MMLRDKFAMAALYGELASQNFESGDVWNTDKGKYRLELAQRCYEISDAMMLERVNWDFSKDPDYMDLKAILSEQNNAMIVPACNDFTYHNEVKEALRAAVTRKHGITHHGNEDIPQLIHQLETGLVF